MSQHTDFVGLPLSNIEKQIIFSLASQSIHPLSVNIANYIGQNSPLELNNFKENVGYGIEAEILNIIVKLGSLEYVTNDENKKYFEKHPYNSTNRVYVSFNNELRGYFNIQSVIEPSTLNTLCNIAKSKSIAIVSGDNNRDEELLKKNIQEDGVHMIFGQNPQQKLDYVAGLQSKNKQVMMVGDGLNDAGALKQAEVGVAITHNQMNFTPSSDIIMKANMFEYIPNIFAVSKWAMYVVYLSFAVSLIYNAIGLYFAMQGKLEPVIAAILMPLNSISVVLISFWGTSMAFKKIFFSKKY
jgi:Cu+-exporting ATPase